MSSASGAAEGGGSSGSSSQSSQLLVDSKIETDLLMVENKISQCEALMIGSDLEMLLATVGFLEACAPRMIELVEAAAQGALSEHVLVRCLEVNDKLHKLLDDVGRNPPGSGAASAAEESAHAPAIGKTKSEDEFDSFFNDRHDAK